MEAHVTREPRSPAQGISGRNMVLQKVNVKISSMQVGPLNTPAFHPLRTQHCPSGGVNNRKGRGQRGSRALTLTTPISRLRLMTKSMAMSMKLEIRSAERQGEQ